MTNPLRNHLTNGRHPPHILIILIIILMTLAGYWQVFHHEFVYFDDDLYIFENPHIRDGLSWEGIRWALTADLLSDSPNADFWIPVTFLSHLLTFELFGLNPAGHHLVNLVFHILNSILLYWVLQSMTGVRWPSFWVAMLFAVHPLHVESVAWVTERKDVLSAFFWLLTIGAYIQYTQRSRWHRYLLLTIFFSLGLMAKPMVATLPVILLLMDYWPLKRIPMSYQSLREFLSVIGVFILEKIPLFIVSLIFGGITFWGMERQGNLSSLNVISLWDRIANALTGYVTYIKKMIWPSNLAVFYPLPSDTRPIWELLVAALVLFVVSALVIRNIRKRPYLFVGWSWYLTALVPVIGLFQVGDQAVADRYAYLPFIGLYVMIAWGATEARERFPQWKVLPVLLVVFLFSVLTVGTRLQVRHWKNSVTLFEHALRVTGENFKLRHNMGIAYYKLGRKDEAIRHYQSAITLNPNFPDGYNNLGIILAEQGQTDRAITQYQAALKLRSSYFEAHYNLGNAYRDLGRMEESVKAYQAALTLRPSYAEAHRELGLALKGLGRVDESLQEIRITLGLSPNDAAAHNLLGELLLEKGELQGAVNEFETVTKLEPSLPEGHNNLANGFLLLGRINLAIHEYEVALDLKQDHTIAYNLALAYQQAGRMDEARRVLHLALEIDPGFQLAREALSHLP